MEKFRLIPLLTAAVMGCTALLAGCGKGSDSPSSKAEEGAKTSDDGSINKDLTATELARLLGNGTTSETPWKPTVIKAILPTPTLKALKLSGVSLSQRKK